MRSPGIVQRHPELRWLASAVVLAVLVVAGVSAVATTFRDDDTALPATSPDELVSALRTPHLGGYSGTIVTHVDLGLPAALTATLGGLIPSGGVLLRGSHTLRYWYGGPGLQRAAVVGQASEQDVIRNAGTVWIWDTGSQIARRVGVEAAATASALPVSLSLPAALTPPQLAERIVAGTHGDDTDATLRSGEPVADRPTYELTLRPRAAGSRISSVLIQIDGQTSVPVRVQVFTLGAGAPAIDVGFTAISFGHPAARNFTFRPPRDATVVTAEPDGLVADVDRLTQVPSGWTTVAKTRSLRTARVLVSVLGATAPPVRGAWGRGVLLRSPLLSVLVTRTGTIAVGTVSPALLYRALK